MAELYNNHKKTTVSNRIEKITELLDGSRITPMIDFNNTFTENFTGTVYDLTKSTPEDSSSNLDSRYILGKKNYNLYDVMEELNASLTYIKSGAFGHTFKGTGVTKNKTQLNFALKVVAYPKTRVKILREDGKKVIKTLSKDEIHNIKRPENAELKMIKLLSQFVVKMKNPHIALPIATFNTNIKFFVDGYTDIIKDDHEYKEKYEEFVDKYSKGKLHNEVSILMSEWANCGDFGRFCRENKNYQNFSITEWKVFFFQILYTLAIIQIKYPSFRHNDLKPNNILVDKHNSSKIPTYFLNKKKYRLPNIGYHLKIWDFDFACIPGVVDNQKVEDEWTSKFKVDPVRNQYYDMHYFFNTLTRYGFINNFFIDPLIPLEVKEFVNRVVPYKYQVGEFVAEKGRLLHDEEYTTPIEVISTDPFFDEFRLNDDEKHSHHHTHHLKPENIKANINTVSRVRVKSKLFDNDVENKEEFDIFVKKIKEGGNSHVHSNHDDLSSSKSRESIESNKIKHRNNYLKLKSSLLEKKLLSDT
jgi:hypothetical protein